MNEEAIKDAYGLFTNTGYNGSYEDFKQLIQSNPEARADAYGLFTSTGYNGSQQDFDQLMGVGGPVPVKKKEEPTVLPWNQKPVQPKPMPEPALPFLESKPSGISLGSQRVPEAPPMFEAPPMRTPEQVKAIVEAPEKAAETADSEQGWLLNTVSALDRGFAKGLIGNPVKAMGTLLEGATGKVFGGSGKGPISDALISFGDYFNKAIDELAPQDEAYKNSLSDQFGQAFGQVASLILTGGVTGAGKEGVALAAAPQGAMGVAKEAGKKLATDLASPTAISAGLSMGQAEFDRAKELGATDDQAFEVFYKNAAVGSILEQIPVMQFLKRFNQSSAGGVANYIKTKGVSGLTGGFEEMTTEVLQQLYANKSAQDIYNINQSILEGVGESGGVGFGVGFLLNAMGARAKVLRKEGKPEEAQLIENQIAEFENKPTTPPASYSINGIKVDSPKVIDDMIETMDVENLTKANIEITNDPVLSNKLQDKMITSSIKEEVREANPNLDEQTLDQITALEKERRKFEGKKTQTAKDKLSSINSQIKSLQENAVQKPSTEEGVLRPEEPQVGLQEVGEGDAKEQAPAQEVVKEEVVTPEEDLTAALERIEIPDDTEALPGRPVLSEESQKIKTKLEDISNAFDEYLTSAEESASATEKRATTKKSNKAFKKLQDFFGFDIGNVASMTEDQLKKRDAFYALREDGRPIDELMVQYDNDVAEGNQSKLVESVNTIIGITPKEIEVVSSKTPQAKAPKAKGVPIPVAIPKPAPEPTPTPVVTRDIIRTLTDEQIAPAYNEIPINLLPMAESVSIQDAVFDAYQKSKKSGKNIELVKAVEDAVSSKTQESAPAPAPAPTAVVSQPTTKAVGPEALRQEYINKIAEVRLNQDKSRTPKQIDEKVKELQAEYNKLKAEMTAPKPKAAPAPKVEAKTTKKQQEIEREIKRLESDIEVTERRIEEFQDEIEIEKGNYEEAKQEIRKRRDELKGKKMSKAEREEANEEIAADAQQAKDDYEDLVQQYKDDIATEKADLKRYQKELAKLKATPAPKAEPTPVSVVEEEEPSYDEIKDLDPTDETALKKILNKLDSMDNGLGEFGRGNLSSGIAIPLARAIIKSIKVLVKAGITVEEAIKRIASENNLEANAVKKMIIDIDKAQTALKKLKDQIKAEVRVATDVKNDMNKKRKNLSKVINDMEVSGKISAFKAKAVINRINKLNLDSSVAVDRFIDYVDKVFYDAEYLDKLNTAKETRSRIRKLSKSKDKFANLRELGSKFIEIDPSMVDNIDEYNKIATLIKDSIKGSTTRGADVKLANIMKESDAMDYINKTMDAQREMILNEKANEVQDLLGIDASDLTYEQLVELVDSDKPLTKYNEGLIRAAINKAFDVYSSMINASIRNGKDVFTDEDVEYSANQKRVVKEFMSMDLNVLKPKQALEAVDALVNFLQNQSIAKMESVVAKYKGETAMREIEKKGIKAKPIRKYWSKGLGRLLIEQTANLPIVFERMFGGFTRGGMVEDAMGITALKNGKSKAQSQSNAVVDNYVKELYNSKPNNEAFNTAENDIERGMTAFMMRNIVGTEAEMQSEFNRRKKLIEESIKVLAEGNELEVKKGKIYEKVYNKILKDSKNIDDVVSKSSEENNKGVKLWQSTWADKYPELYDVALGVYNKVLGRDVNFTPDRFAKLSSDPGEVDLTSEDMGFLVNSGTAPLYKKETGVLMAATRPESLPRNPNTQKPNRYVDLSFDRNNANSYYDALVDINTAAPIRQVQSALNSDSFATIMKGTGDERLLRNRIDLFVRNIRNKNPFSNDEFSKAVKNLNRLASVGVGQALGGVLQPVKQVAPIAMNTLINAGGLDIPSVFDLSKQEFINNSGYAIANRGIESQAQIESLNKMIEEAASSKPEQAIKAIEKINNWWLKSFLVKPDVYIARASWMTYYEQSLKKQGIDPATIDYSTHEINEEAANYAQRQVDRQQNISDSDLAGALLSDKDASKQLFVKVLMPFASFRMNQSARLGSDLATLTDKTSTKEDKKIAARSLGGFAVEMAVFRIVSAASALLIAELVKGIMDRDDDEEKDKKKNDAIIKGQLTSTVADVFSPTPLLDKGVQIGASAILDATQDALDVNEEDRLDIYSGNKQDFFQSLGLLGISGARASQLYEMSKLAAGGSYEDNYGRKKYLSEKDRDAIATLIPIAIVSNTGLAPSEVNSIVRSSLADAKRSGSTVGGEGKSKSEESKAIELNKTDLKRYYPDIYEQYYGEGTEEAERRKLKQEQNKLEREIKDEYYDYKSEPNKKSSKTKTNTNISGFGGKGFAD